MKSLVFVIVLLAIGQAAVPARSEEALEAYDKTAEAAERQVMHMKSPDSDTVLTPVVNGVISENTAIRRRARQILEERYLKDGRLAIDHFERLTWEKLDGRGRGMYLWSWATHRRWNNPTPGRPLPQSKTIELWSKAAEEPVALPYMKETAALLFKRWRDANNPPSPVGDGLSTVDRRRLARQYLSVFEACDDELERVAVLWMILDLHNGEDDSMIVDWYSAQTQPQERLTLLEALNQIVAPSEETDVRISRVTANAKDRLQARAMTLTELGNLAMKDWHAPAAEAGAALIEGVEALEATAPEEE